VRDVSAREQLVALCREVSGSLSASLPRGVEFILLLVHGATDPRGAMIQSGSNLRHDLAVAAVQDWLDSAAQPAPLGPMFHEALTILRTTKGKGLAVGALTPARAFLMGALGAIADANETVAFDETVIAKATAYLEELTQIEAMTPEEVDAELARGSSHKVARDGMGLPVCSVCGAHRGPGPDAKWIDFDHKTVVSDNCDEARAQIEANKEKPS
jgi:hypothetical protein